MTSRACVPVWRGCVVCEYSGSSVGACLALVDTTLSVESDEDLPQFSLLCDRIGSPTSLARAAVAGMPKGQEWLANGAQMGRHQLVAYAFSRLNDHANQTQTVLTDRRDLGEYVSDQTISKVWILSGVTGSEPAMLSHDADLVTLSTFDDDDEPIPAFSVETAEISEVKFPAYQFSGGCSFVVAGHKYRISFLQPQNSKMPTYYNRLSGMTEIGSGRKAGKAWKNILPT